MPIFKGDGAPQAGVGGSVGGVDEGGVGNALELLMEGKKLKVLTPAYLAELIQVNLKFPQLKLKLEKDFPGYKLPCEADLEALKLQGNSKKMENLGKLTSGVSETEFTFLTCEEGEDFNRTKIATNDSFKERALHERENTTTQPHLAPGDLLFLIKKTNS